MPTFDLTDIERIEADLIGEDDLSQDVLDLIASFITPSSAFITSYLGVRSDYFKPAAETPVQRTFYGDGTDYIKLPPYVDDGSVEITLPDGYLENDLEVRDNFLVRVYPDYGNETFDLMDVDRWNRYYTARTPLYPRTGWAVGAPVKVTARWGFVAVPDDIELACRRLVERLWRTKDGQVSGIIGDIVRPDGTAIQQALPPFVKMTLENWKSRIAQGLG